MLTNIAIRNAKPGPKPRRLFDGKGLYIEISPRGRKRWWYKYRIQRREKRISPGVYPEVSLKEARQKLSTARSLVAQGIDPSPRQKNTPGSMGEDARKPEEPRRALNSVYQPETGNGNTGLLFRLNPNEPLPEGSHELIAQELYKGGNSPGQVTCSSARPSGTPFVFVMFSVMSRSVTDALTLLESRDCHRILVELFRLESS